MDPNALMPLSYQDAGRLALSVFLGGLIGFERRWHGHAAGPHTNGLVAFGAALFVLIGHAQGGKSVGRVVSQVATGIGFLAGGVILRDGLRVRGLNTAATVWCVAAVGCLVAIGYLYVALAATFIVVGANTVFHLIEHNIPRLRRVAEADVDEEEKWRDRPPPGMI